MRAIVLLCLLHAALAQHFSWNKLGSPSPEPDPNSVCVTDQSSCNCCMMVKEINRLKTYFNTTLYKLEEEYVLTKQSLDNIEASHTAASVALYNGNNFRCVGPFKVNTLIVYKHVFLNLGDAYSVETGIFTVPRSGVYSLALTIYSDAGSPGNTLACATLQVNGKAVAGAREQNMQDQEDSATVVVALHLNAGDKVAVNLPIGCFLCDDGNHYNSFSAFLLYPTGLFREA